MTAPLAKRVLCWHCNQPLVAKNGMATGRPLIFASVAIEPERTVKTHKRCEKDAKVTLRYLTAEPKSADQMDAQIDDQLGFDQ